MLNGKNNFENLGWFIAILFIVFYGTNCKSPTCDDACNEKEFNKKIDLGKYNQEGIDFYQKLTSLGLIEDQEKVIKVRALFDKEISKIILIERMSIDFEKICNQIKFDDILKDKEFCQILKIEYTNKEEGYIIGRCEYDLMGFSKSYSKIGFDLASETQYLLPLDNVTILYSPRGIEKFTLDSKEYKPILVNCK